MSAQESVFDYEQPLPAEKFSRRESKLLGLEERYSKVHLQLRLLLKLDELPTWSKRNYGGKVVPLCDLISDQYPLVIFHGDVGTGKTVSAECIANRLVREAKAEDSVLFKLSNRVRGSGKVGEMGTLILEAFKRITASAGKARRAILILDEGDSIGASRTQEHSHHEDKVAVNTLIQCIDNLRNFGGRVVVILCTNRLSVLDAALLRRAALVEEFNRPNDTERRTLLSGDLADLGLSESEIEKLVVVTGPSGAAPGWTYSDFRSRLYPAALSRAFPERGVKFEDFHAAARNQKPTPVLEDN
jgi:AAA+ superfamily predicted ATPase